MISNLLDTRLGEALAAVAPRLSDADLNAWRGALQPPMAAAGITTDKRAAAFLGQVAHESAGFRVLSENLHYSAARLCAVWPTRFPRLALAVPYAGNPEKLANRVYAERLGNGREETGDGWRFRGRGLLQLTGRANYGAFGSTCGLTAEQAAPYVETREGAAASAVWFWRMGDLNALADAWRIEEIGRRVNGGSHGARDRLRLSNAALRMLEATLHENATA